MEAPEVYRELCDSERQLLERLLEARFPGRDEIAEQIRTCLVKTLDEHGCLEFFVRSHTNAAVDQRVPVEAEACDEEGNKIHMLLHVINGRINELEFYTESGAAIKRLPSANEWELIVLPPPPRL